ncbi:MAG: peptidase rane alanine aminopeptidase [Acidobacteriales bacterium]|nr:peptidase rane alanine aminopeptidase [Terriglobales bacterium]
MRLDSSCREDTIANLTSKVLPIELLSRSYSPSLLTIFVLPFVLLFAANLATAQTTAPVPVKQQPAPDSAAGLYRRLSTLGLDSKLVFDVRDAALDREDIHLSLNDGTIAFTESVNGEITGAVFVGEGEVLLVPPNQVERHSLAMFTDSAVLNEKFTLAYFRFSDKHFLSDLQPALRKAASPAEFIERQNTLAKALAESDALRALIALTRAPKTESEVNAPTGEFIRARLSGVHLGLFDLSWDTGLSEQIAVGQSSYTDRGRHYDQWMMFPMRSVRQREEARRQKHISADDLYIDSVLITDYKTRTQVRPPTDLNVEATLTLDVRTSGERTLPFELSRALKVSSVTLETPSGAVPLEYIQNESLEGSQLSSRGNDIVAVVFPQPLVAKQKLKIRFTYAGSVMSEAGGGLLYVGARGIWYPNRGPWMSNFDLEFENPADWKLIATGKKVEHSEKDGNEMSRWVSERPIPLAGFNLGKYISSSAKATNGATIVESYAARAVENNFPGASQQPEIIPRRKPDDASPALGGLAMRGPLDPARNASIVAERSARTIDFLSARLGPFPYGSLALTQMPGSDSQGWPGLVFLSSHVFLTPSERAAGRSNYLGTPNEIIYDRLMEAHETAHQWWGDAVFWQSYRDQWVMEALANYSALLELEAENPEAAKVLMEYYRRELLTPSRAGTRPRKEAGPVSLGLRLSSSKFPGAYDAVAYGRGTWLLHMLREMLRDAALLQSSSEISAVNRGKKTRIAPAPQQATGADPDALFFTALRNVHKRFSGKVMSTQDLQLAFEEVLPASLRFEGKRSLDWFFEGWVNGTALPKIELENVKLSSASGKTIARAILRQKDAPEALVTSVPIYASTANGKMVLVDRVFADGEETTIKLNVPPGTKKLLLDPLQTVLMSN